MSVNPFVDHDQMDSELQPKEDYIEEFRNEFRGTFLEDGLEEFITAANLDWIDVLYENQQSISVDPSIGGPSEQTRAQVSEEQIRILLESETANWYDPGLAQAQWFLILGKYIAETFEADIEFIEEASSSKLSQHFGTKEELQEEYSTMRSQFEDSRNQIREQTGEQIPSPKSLFAQKFQTIASQILTTISVFYWENEPEIGEYIILRPQDTITHVMDPLNTEPDKDFIDTDQPHIVAKVTGYDPIQKSISEVFGDQMSDDLMIEIPLYTVEVISYDTEVKDIVGENSILETGNNLIGPADEPDVEKITPENPLPLE